MTTSEIHNRFEVPTTYSWSARVTLRHLDPAKDGQEVQFGGTDRFADPYEAELVIFDKIASGAKVAFPAHAVGGIEIVRFTRASDAGLA